MKTKTIVLASAALLVSFTAIAGEKGKITQPTAETQKLLTPDSVLKELEEGNEYFVKAITADPNIKARRDIGTKGQNPKAFILSCIDSRVPVEQVFNQGIGDLFVGRVAGNIETTEQLGSMEYAAAVGGVKVVMVLGHEACGAVKGACDHVEMGNITPLLDHVEPAIDEVKGHADERTSKNAKFVSEVVAKNVEMTVKDIRKRSKILAGLEKAGKLKIVGGVYSLHTGKVTMLN